MFASLVDAGDAIARLLDVQCDAQDTVQGRPGRTKFGSAGSDPQDRWQRPPPRRSTGDGQLLGRRKRSLGFRGPSRSMKSGTQRGAPGRAICISPRTCSSPTCQSWSGNMSLVAILCSRSGWAIGSPVAATDNRSGRRSADGSGPLSRGSPRSWRSARRLTDSIQRRPRMRSLQASSRSSDNGWDGNGGNAIGRLALQSHS